ncbi:amidohydrolase family protein [Blastococcus sp. SYSU D00820]
MRAHRAAHAFDGDRVLPGGALVLVADGRIAGVEPAGAPVPADCPVTDHRNATLLPGLIDTHVHLCADAGPRALDTIPDLSAAALDRVVETSLRRHLAAGVTAVRDLGDHRWAVVERHRGRVEGPTVVASGPPITSPGGHCASMGGEVTGPDGLRRAVRERAERGADLVKVMVSGGMLTPGTDPLACQFDLADLRVLVDEAHRLGLPVAAHAHPLTAVERALDAGVDGIEHCSCLTPDGIRTPPGVAARLARGPAAVCPTVGNLPGADPPPHVRARMAAAGAGFEQLLAHAGDLCRAGVRPVAGTDAGIAPGKPHGVLPYAVAELVSGGLAVPEALAAATGRAADACGLTGRTGRLAAGLDADLLVVDGDATADVGCLLRPRLVVSRGREVDLGPEPR